MEENVKILDIKGVSLFVIAFLLAIIGYVVKFYTDKMLGVQYDLFFYSIKSIIGIFLMVLPIGIIVLKYKKYMAFEKLIYFVGCILLIVNTSIFYMKIPNFLLLLLLVEPIFIILWFKILSGYLLANKVQQKIE